MGAVMPVNQRFLMLPVVSSNISHVGYDYMDGSLHIRFHSGAEWRYHDVPPQVHGDLVKADSIGRHFTQHIRDKFQGHKKS